jgi:hypothetical protein
MKRLILFSTILFFNTNFFSQQWEWAYETGPYLPSIPALVASTADDDVFTTGSGPAEVHRYTKNGVLKWTYTMGGSGVYPVEICTDLQKNCYLLARFWSNLVLPDTTITNSGNYDMFFIIAFDSTGNRKWYHLYPGEASSCNQLICDKNGDLLFCSSGGSAHSVFLRKISPAGNVVWNTTFTYKINFDHGISTRSIRVDSNNNIYLGGVFTGDTLLINNTVNYLEHDTSYNEKSFILKFNQSGQLLGLELMKGANIWDFKFDAMDNMYVLGRFIKKIKIRNDSMYIGACSSYHCDYNFIAKLPPSGPWQWLKTNDNIYGFPFEKTMDVSPDGHMIFTGWVGSPVTLNNFTVTPCLFVGVLDPSGSTQAIYSTPQTFWPHAISYSGNSGIYVSGEYAHTVTLGLSVLPDAPPPQIHYFVARMSYSQLITTVKAQQPVSDELIVAPNPGQGLYKIHTSEEIEVVTIYDLQGKKMISVKQTNFDISACFKGVYLAEIRCRNKTWYKKLVLD